MRRLLYVSFVGVALSLVACEFGDSVTSRPAEYFTLEEWYLDVSGEGESYLFYVDALDEWQCESEEDWIACERVGNSVHITVGPNLAHSGREGSVMLYNDYYEQYASIWVEQGYLGDGRVVHFLTPKKSAYDVPMSWETENYSSVAHGVELQAGDRFCIKTSQDGVFYNYGLPFSSSGVPKDSLFECACRADGDLEVVVGQSGVYDIYFDALLVGVDDTYPENGFMTLMTSGKSRDLNSAYGTWSETESEWCVVTWDGKSPFEDDIVRYPPMYALNKELFDNKYEEVYMAQRAYVGADRFFAVENTATGESYDFDAPQRFNEDYFFYMTPASKKRGEFLSWGEDWYDILLVIDKDGNVLCKPIFDALYLSYPASLQWSM